MVPKPGYPEVLGVPARDRGVLTELRRDPEGVTVMTFKLFWLIVVVWG